MVINPLLCGGKLISLDRVVTILHVHGNESLIKVIIEVLMIDGSLQQN